MNTSVLFIFGQNFFGLGIIKNLVENCPLQEQGIHERLINWLAYPEYFLIFLPEEHGFTAILCLYIANGRKYSRVIYHLKDIFLDFNIVILFCMGEILVGNRQIFQ